MARLSWLCAQFDSWSRNQFATDGSFIGCRKIDTAIILSNLVQDFNLAFGGNDGIILVRYPNANRSVQMPPSEKPLIIREQTASYLTGIQKPVENSVIMLKRKRGVSDEAGTSAAVNSPERPVFVPTRKASSGNVPSNGLANGGLESTEAHQQTHSGFINGHMGPAASRKVRACEECRRQKIKCEMLDEQPPCTRCRRKGSLAF